MRPFYTSKEFSENKEITLKAITSLKDHYYEYLLKHDGKIESLKLESEVFDKVKNDINTTSIYEMNLLESIFDQFLGCVAYSPKEQDLFEFLEAILFLNIDYILDTEAKKQC